MILLTGLFAVVLSAVHVGASQLRFLGVVPRSRWLSLAGGVSVAYVFVHVLPDLHKGQHTLQDTTQNTVFHWIEAHAYLISLLGLCFFYGLEKAARASRKGNRSQTESEQAPPGVFWLHVASYGLYNALIGYLLVHREVGGWKSLIFYVTAIGLHFMVNDYGLRQHHRGRYDRLGRWLLGLAVILGWICGWQFEISRAWLAVLFAFLAGGIIMNVLKEELPEERLSRFWPFAAGAAGYALLLLATA